MRTGRGKLEERFLGKEKLHERRERVPPRDGQGARSVEGPTTCRSTRSSGLGNTWPAQIGTEILLKTEALIPSPPGSNVCILNTEH